MYTKFVDDANEAGPQVHSVSSIAFYVRIMLMLL